jgi:hypothetical protein
MARARVSRTRASAPLKVISWAAAGRRPLRKWNLRGFDLVFVRYGATGRRFADPRLLPLGRESYLNDIS